MPKCQKLAYERLGEKLAAKHPERVEKMYDEYANAVGFAPSGHWHMGLCYEMATSDLVRAERIADRVLERSDLFQPLDTATMAAGLRDKPAGAAPTQPSSGPAIKRAMIQGFLAHSRFEAGDHDGAKRLLADAFSRLRRIDESAIHTRSGYVWKSSEAMAILLMVAERVDPDSAAEFYWAALAQLTQTQEIDSHDSATADHSTFDFVRILRRYDERIAWHVTQPLLERAVSRSHMGAYSYGAAGCLAWLDAANREQWVKRFSDRPSTYLHFGHISPKAQVERNLLEMRLGNASSLADNDDRDWVHLLGEYWMEEMYEKITHRSLRED